MSSKYEQAIALKKKIRDLQTRMARLMPHVKIGIDQEQIIDPSDREAFQLLAEHFEKWSSDIAIGPLFKRLDLLRKEAWEEMQDLFGDLLEQPRDMESVK